MNKPTQNDLLEAMEKETLLTDFGMGIFDQRNKTREEIAEKFKIEREALANNLEHFQICCEWLSLCRPRKTINYRIGTSYGLKHALERYYDPRRYVTNGAFIAAVIHLKIPYKKHYDSPNILIALSSKLPKSAE